MLLVRALVLAAVATAVVGTVGRGYTIRLTRNGKLVKSLKAGRYTFRISDRSRIHDFVLEESHGGGFERRITSVPFVGTQRISVRLTRGEWEFSCAPHESTMHGDFTVT